jgi:hypothetical protein
LNADTNALTNKKNSVAYFWNNRNYISENCLKSGVCRQIWEEWVFQFLRYFEGTGGGTQGFKLVMQALYCLSHTSSPFYFGYFGDGIWRTLCLG